MSPQPAPAAQRDQARRAATPQVTLAEFLESSRARRR